MFIVPGWSDVTPNSTMPLLLAVNSPLQVAVFGVAGGTVAAVATPQPAVVLLASTCGLSVVPWNCAKPLTSQKSIVVALADVCVSWTSNVALGLVVTL